MTAASPVAPAQGPSPQEEVGCGRPSRPAELLLAKVARPLLAAAVTVVLVAVLVAAMGASPAKALDAIVQGSVGTPFSLGQTVMLASVLALTGLAATVPFTARLFNVGAEGQLYAGALAATAVGLEASGGMPRWLTVVLVLGAGAAAGGLWGAIPGAMRALAGANEVIVSLMLTFVAALLADYATIDIWPSGLAQNTRALPDDALLPILSPSMSLTLGAPVALVVVGLIWVVMRRGSLGFQIRATGFNEDAARLNGIPVARVQIVAFVIGGATAGLAGAILVAGIDGSLVAGGAGGYGFLGIAVALVARLSPLAIVPSALLFAALQVGSNGLQVEAGISSATGSVLTGALVISLLAFGVIRLNQGGSR